MILNDYLKKLIKSLTGNIIVIGIRNDQLNDLIMKSKKLNQCYFLNSETKEETKKKRWKLGGGKSIPIKKFKRKFKKKKTDFIICNIEDMNKDLNRFIKDSVYICSNKIYYFGAVDQFDVFDISRKYARYGATVTTSKLSDSCIVVVDVSKAKYNRIKAAIYIINDGFSIACDLFGDFLVK